MLGGGQGRSKAVGVVGVCQKRMLVSGCLGSMSCFSGAIASPSPAFPMLTGATSLASRVPPKTPVVGHKSFAAAMPEPPISRASG